MSDENVKPESTITPVKKPKQRVIDVQPQQVAAQTAQVETDNPEIYDDVPGASRVVQSPAPTPESMQGWGEGVDEPRQSAQQNAAEFVKPEMDTVQHPPVPQSTAAPPVPQNATPSQVEYETDEDYTYVPNIGDQTDITTRFGIVRIQWDMIDSSTALESLLQMTTIIELDSERKIRKMGAKGAANVVAELKEFFRELISQRIVFLVEPLPEDNLWLRMLKRSRVWKEVYKPMIDDGALDTSEESDLEFMYLSEVVFNNAEATELLREYAISLAKL